MILEDAIPVAKENAELDRKRAAEAGDDSNNENDTKTTA